MGIGCQLVATMWVYCLWVRKSIPRCLCCFLYPPVNQVQTRSQLHLYILYSFINNVVLAVMTTDGNGDRHLVFFLFVTQWFIDNLIVADYGLHRLSSKGTVSVHLALWWSLGMSLAVIPGKSICYWKQVLGQWMILVFYSWLCLMSWSLFLV